VKQLIKKTIAYVLCIALILGTISVVSAENRTNNTKQIFTCNYTNNVSLLGTAGEIGAGFIPGIGQVQSGRDLINNITNWKWSWGHIGQTALNAIGLIPVIGGLKNIGKADELIKGVEEASKIAKAIDKAEPLAKEAGKLDDVVPGSIWNNYFKQKYGASNTEWITKGVEEVSWYNTSVEDVKWTNHNNKHVPQKGLTWKNIIESTLYGDARYKPGINIEELEKFAWANGTPVTNGHTWKVYKADKIIGANSGIETPYMRIEITSGNVIHGHPITYADYLDYLKVRP